MDEKIKKRLDHYVELLNEVKKHVSNEDTAASMVSEIAKDRRVEMMQKNGNGNGSPATERQKQFMTKLGIDYPDSVTKKEASKLIDEELAKNGK